MSAVEARGAPYTLTLQGPRVVYGLGIAGTDLAAELDRLEVRRVLLVATSRERNARQGLIEPVADRIAGHVLDVRRHVPIESARAATELARELEADGLLSIGGGSAVGMAKAVALETGLPIVALPTTYAGSEMTPIYGITDGGTKRTGRSARVLPRTVLLDPTLSAELPLATTRFSAVNALAHCTGGLFAAGRNPLTDLLAIGGVRFLTDGLRRVAEDVAAREDLAQGAYVAGTVLAHAGASLHHGMCHILGGTFDLPHAETHAAVLPAALAFLEETFPQRAIRLRDVLGDVDVAAGVGALLREVGVTVRLRDIGLAERDLAMASRLLSKGVPGMEAARASRLLREAW